MSASDYINRYIDEAKIESQHAKESWLKNFFKSFSDELSTRSERAAPGDKYVITSSFSTALPNLIPNGLLLNKESSVKNYIDMPKEKALCDLLIRKRIDFSIDGKEKTLLIEFKTNVQFNDLAAAMVEMSAIKSFAARKPDKEVRTASLHLFPYRTNVDGLRLLNVALGNPLDHIWVLCTPELKYDIDAIKSFRKEVCKIVG